MRTLLLCAVMSATLAVPQAPSQPPSRPLGQAVRTARQWTLIRDGDARFTGEFPAPPLRQTQPNGMVRWMVQLDNDSYAYIMGVITIPGERMALGVPRLLDDAVAGGVRNVTGSELIRDSPITFQGYPGREILVRAPGTGSLPLRIVARAIISGDRLYVLTAVAPFEGFDQKEIDRFLGSLSIE